MAHKAAQRDRRRPIPLCETLHRKLVAKRRRSGPRAAQRRRVTIGEPRVRHAHTRFARRRAACGPLQAAVVREIDRSVFRGGRA